MIHKIQQLSKKLLVLGLLAWPLTTSAADTLKRSQYNFQKDIMPIFEKYCTSCHGPEKKKGGVRITDLDPDFVKGPDANKWYGMLDVMNLGEMPPKKKDQPTDEERRKIIDWLTVELKYATQVKSGDTKTIMRRLNKQQYTNSLKELLDVDVNFGKELPSDGLSHEGFTNNGETLTMSTLHMDYYMKIAREALDKAIVTGDAPEIYKFKTTISKNISSVKGKASLGYQSIAIPKSDYLLEELVPKDKTFKATAHKFQTQFSFTNNPKSSGNKNTNSLYDSFYIDMRGSNKKRFSIEKEGMLLKSSLPHVEKAAQVWQGPAPNLKVIMRDFPKEGNFRVTIQAAKAPMQEQKLKYFTPKDKETKIQFESKTLKLSKAKDSIVIDARKPHKQKGLNINKKYVHTKKGPTYIAYKFNIPKNGLYQLDAVYAAREKRPQFLKIGTTNIDYALGSLTGSWDKLEAKAVAVVSLYKGERELYLKNTKGPIPHIHSFILTPISPDDPLQSSFKQATQGGVKVAKNDPYLRVFMGNRLDDGMEYKTFDEPQKVTAPVGTVQTLHFHGRLEDMPLPVIDKNDNTFLANMALFGVWNDSFVTQGKDSGSPVYIKSLEFEGPYYESWPPQSHKNIFISSKNKNNKEVYTREILTHFMTKAFRRPPASKELDRLVSFWKQNHQDFPTYEDSIKELLVAVLCSPNFLYIAEPEEKPSAQISEFNLASRLSYFLWNSMPDERLLELASKNKLRESLSAEVKRMLKDPKVMRLSEAFSDEWLDLHRLNNVGINISMYPAFTRFVKEDMAKETHHFFHEVLTKDLSIMNFIDSDFLMLNQNLAQFYNIPKVYGSKFRRVSVPRNKRRGGLLSQGSFLTGHSSGEDSHPIKRGVWLIEKIIDNPPPEPPPNVPLPDPEDPELAKLTKKQQLEKHRDNASCRDCHRKIDPWGVPFEQYDAVGKLRAKIITKKGTMPVDAQSDLINGTIIKGVDDLKKYIIENEKNSVNRAVTKHLLSYALGRSLSFTDDESLSGILEHVRKNNYKMQAVVEGIVNSKLFNQR
ncbi:MAG: DUF1592 domain-containing protein [Lentisphaeraceae bacterium]|nr:DUF1592 domain-containing protein [Lentisphaeraceae bacterium]